MSPAVPPVPEDRCYDGTQHVWVQRDPASGRVVLGLDALGLESLGELVYLTLPAPGTEVHRGGTLGSLEAAKMTSTLAAPLSGTVVEPNEAVLRNPPLVNRDPYGAGWLVVLTPSRWEEERSALVAGPAIRPWAEREAARLRAGSPIER